MAKNKEQYDLEERLQRLYEEGELGKTLRMADGLTRVRDFSNAIAQYGKVIRLKPVYEAFANRGYCHLSLGDYDMALQDWESASRVEPNHPQLYLLHGNRGLAYKAKGDLVRAVSEFDNALRLNPRYAEGHVNKANVLQQMGRIDEALPCYESFISLANPREHPEHAEVIAIVKTRISSLRTAPPVKTATVPSKATQEALNMNWNAGPNQQLSCGQIALRLAQIKENLPSREQAAKMSEHERNALSAEISSQIRRYGSQLVELSKSDPDAYYYLAVAVFGTDMERISLLGTFQERQMLLVFPEKMNDYLRKYLIAAPSGTFAAKAQQLLSVK